MHKLVEYICDEMEELERKADKDGKLSMAEVQYLDTLAHTKKNLLKADEMMDGEYSMDDGGSYDGGASMDMRRGGSSYRNSYARGRGRNARRDSMGRYSRDGGYSRAEDNVDSIVEELHSIMGSLPEEKRREAERFVHKMESM